jgi:hypothetical protein
LHKKLAAVLAFASIGFVTLVGAGSPASAATVAPVVGPQLTAVSVPSAEIARRSWTRLSDYEQLWMCKEAGQALIDSGQFTNFSCQYRRGVYELWVLFP